MRRYTVRAVASGQEIARTSDALLIEGNFYFPSHDVISEALEPARLRTLCVWKGIARYQHVIVNGERISHGAWVYPLPLPWAWFVKGRVAFDVTQGIDVVQESTQTDINSRENRG
ncbi:DUF427 domain-containing protein [Rothia sp. P6271]|uniref:DUF427 domain-containing protein n=1 Tax=unclassified Rothia (in: high G+C Gram-positive bacteria) TaxID=2689056 RepID=UPI003AD26C25